jgi:phosphoglycolate phosphatase
MKNLTILFDMDGTLIDSTAAILESFGAAFEKMGIEFSDSEKIPPLIGYPLDAIFVKLGIQTDKTDDFITAYKAHYKTVAAKKTVLINKAKEAVEKAYEFARLGIVTTKTSLYTKEILEHFDMLKQFEVVIGREDAAYTKPHPEPILKALKAMNADKQNAWMIGDTILDMGAGKAAGVKCVGVLCGYGTKEDLARCTDNIFEDVFEAVLYIKSVSR